MEYPIQLRPLNYLMVWYTNDDAFTRVADVSWELRWQLSANIRQASEEYDSK